MRLAINALEPELAGTVAACRREGVGIEVTAFSFPDRLDGGLGGRIEAHREAIECVDYVSSHGPFMDLYVTSVDPAVVDVCRRRHEQALEASLAVGATIYVAHMNSIPLIRNPRYRDRFCGTGRGGLAGPAIGRPGPRPRRHGGPGVRRA